ncbi:hypothetical protein [Streptomyces collinus]|uniref:Uncharacterized protein n=1 Tax=Streptomyces collinus (strain DSM 40733 / Tue 365) TaxID=1214242 RepID=S5UV93_STRC3|nr:hypothetical protein [Streptomyces collinus]AGS67004.1 hypothetical protein B446_00830 [Streptomyces collinus Tu 365]AGS73690.1 hypothetical protein B446_34460 [Streptomyces collinus Tu 365]
MSDETLQDTLPSSQTDAADRFEAAPDPDGTLIPIPREAPAGTPVRDDATINVSPRQNSGYYVTIYNGPPESSSEMEEFVGELLQEASLKRIAQMFAETAAGGVLEFLEGPVGVAVSLLNSKPTMNEQFIRTKLDDGTPVTYAVLSPGH